MTFFVLDFDVLATLWRITIKYPLSKEQYFSEVLVDSVQYPVYKNGQGPISALGLGIGTILSRTFSDEFYQQFSYYSTDLYWVKSHPLDDADALSLDRIVDDYAVVLNRLNLPQPLLIAHSCYGLVALELAKRKDIDISGVILIGTPPKWDEQLITFCDQYFSSHASAERRLNHLKRQEHYQSIRQPSDSIINLNAYIADTAKYWGDFLIDESIIANIWDNIAAEDRAMNQFFDYILPHYDSSNFNQIEAPVVLVAGHCDYDCLPHETWKSIPKPLNFSVIDCGDVGHWPHFEAPEAFIGGLLKWLNENYSTVGFQR